VPNEKEKLTKSELEEDQFLEWIVNAGEYIKQRKQAFVGGAVAVLAVVVISVVIVNEQEQARLMASEQLGMIRLAEDQGQADDALRLTADLTEAYEGTAAAGQAVVILANRYYSQGNYAEAEKLYQAYIDDYGQVDILVYAAWNGLAACLEARGDNQGAAVKYEAFAKTNPTDLHASTALFEAARCYGEAGSLDNQRAALNKIVEDFARSPLAGKAREELKML
jgi:TolA-binding protein